MKKKTIFAAAVVVAAMFAPSVAMAKERSPLDPPPISGPSAGGDSDLLTHPRSQAHQPVEIPTFFGI